MADNIEDGRRPIFTGKAPGFLSQWDAETFVKAGLTPFDKLKDRYGDNYTMLVTDAEALRQKLDTDQWQIIVTKCEMGGMIKLAKSMTAHGGKGAVPRDFKVSGDTGLLYERAYDNMPWAYEHIRKKAAQALGKGQDYIYSLREIIEIGEKAAIAAGAKKVRPKYTGTGKVFIFDSATRNGTYADLPNPFPGLKKVRAEVVPKPKYWEPVEGYLMGSARLWKEVNPNRSADAKGVPQGDRPYFTLRLTTAGKDSKQETLPFRQRVMIALIDKKNQVLELKPTTDLMTLADFEAREPRDVQVISINPTTGKVDRSTLPNDDFTEEPDEVFTPLSGLFDGLTLVQPEPTDGYRYTLMGQMFAGRSYIVRLEQTNELTRPAKRWLAPLESSLSAGDAAQHISFDTFDAVNKAMGREPSAEPNAGFEVLDTEKFRDYFGETEFSIYEYLNQEFQTTSRYSADRAATQAGILQGKATWHVLKLKEIIQRQKANIVAEKAQVNDLTAAIADGYTEHLDPDDKYDADAFIRLLGLPSDTTEDVMNAKLEELGYLRRISGKVLYRHDTMADVLAKAEAETEPEEPVKVTAEFSVTETVTEEQAEPELPKVEGDPLEGVSALRTEAVKGAWTPAPPPWTGGVVSSFGGAEPVTEPVAAEPDVIIPEIVDRPYAVMSYEERQLDDRKLIDDVRGRIESIERHAMSIINAFNGEARALTPRVQRMVDDVRFIRDTAREAQTPLATLVDHIFTLKSEAGSDDPLAVIKQHIIKIATHLDLKTVDILACYVKTPTGMVPVFGEDKADQPTA
jgi:hypothetical protein